MNSCEPVLSHTSKRVHTHTDTQLRVRAFQTIAFHCVSLSMHALTKTVALSHSFSLYPSHFRTHAHSLSHLIICSWTHTHCNASQVSIGPFLFSFLFFINVLLVFSLTFSPDPLAVLSLFFFFFLSIFIVVRSF